nr:hypothetical protein CFP56_07518 [Quercus suber]
MPVLPKEGGGDSIAAALNDGTKTEQSSAGDSHNTKASGDAHGLAKASDHTATPGPVMTDKDLGEVVGKEELRKRAEELNK